MANVRILWNGNVKMSPGKMAAQAVHAALAAYGIEHGSVVVLKGSVSKVEQMDVQIRDAGRTELIPGTLTAGASLQAVDGYSEFMSCCRNATQHEQHMKFRAAHKLLEESGYTLIPPVSTGFGVARVGAKPES